MAQRKLCVLRLWRCSRKLAESVAWGIIQKVRVDYTVFLTCCDWDCRVAHLWRTTGTIWVLLRIWRECVWTAKDTSSWCTTEGYSSSMVGDTQVDYPWLWAVPQVYFFIIRKTNSFRISLSSACSSLSESKLTIFWGSWVHTLSPDVTIWRSYIAYLDTSEITSGGAGSCVTVSLNWISPATTSTIGASETTSGDVGSYVTTSSP